MHISDVSMHRKPELAQRISTECLGVGKSMPGEGFESQCQPPGVKGTKGSGWGTPPFNRLCPEAEGIWGSVIL
jgi:hypothetical protein